MSNKILLIIKAETFHQARASAKERGIHIADLCASRSSPTKSFAEFRGRTDKKNLLSVQRWFLEPGECQKNFGYPIGTLLFFKPEE